MAFTASQMQEAQYALNLWLAEPNTARTEWQRGEALSARAVLPRQTAQTLPRFKGDNFVCVGAEVWFYRPGAAALAEVDWPATNDCAVAHGAVGETLKKDLTTGIIAYSTGRVLDHRCDNLLTFTEEFQRQVMQIMAENRRQINNNVVLAGLDAASQTNIDTLLPSTWNGTTDAPLIVAPPEDFTFENLNAFRRVAIRNGFGDYFFLSGELFNDNVWMAGLNRMNETFRNQALAWAQNDISFDIRDLDQHMGQRTVFAVDVNSFAFWNQWNSPSVMTLIDTENQTYVWSQPDPILTWIKDGREVPVVHEMEMSKTCVARDAVGGYRQFQYDISARIIGAFATAPLGPNNESGILQFSDTTPA
jgi:hypothetical protein